MFEKIINKDNKGKIYLKYDKEKYHIEYIESENIIILRRLSDNQVIKVFSDKIGFIIQCNKEEQVNFLVTDYSEKDKNGLPIIRLKHYIEQSYSDSLIQAGEVNCDSADVSLVRITDSSYIVNKESSYGYIYNLKERSKRFYRIYHDPKISEFFNDNTLLVSEKIFASMRNDIYDQITYGINPETFDITSPIWSELQQRYINIYTEEQAEILEKNFLFQNLSNNSRLGEITIYYEIRKYLEELEKFIVKPQEIYLDRIDLKINEDFVKKFVRNK